MSTVRSAILGCLAFALLPIAAHAQQGEAKINFSPVSCLSAGANNVLQVAIPQDGQLRCYFRRVGSTDWCSVVGDTDKSLSHVTLPKFDDGDDIEYYFILAQKNVVLAKSPRIYRAHVGSRCSTPTARHEDLMILECSQPGAAAMPAAVAAGYTVKSSKPEEPVTPEKPH